MHIFHQEFYFWSYSEEIIRDKWNVKNSGCVADDVTLTLLKHPFIVHEDKSVSQGSFESYWDDWSGKALELWTFREMVYICD